MKVRMKDTVETRIVYPHGDKLPIEPLNAIAGQCVKLTEHVHTNDDGDKFSQENWRLPLGAEIDIYDKKAAELTGLDLAEPI